MKKLFLFVAATVLSVTAHAFDLSMENRDATGEVKPTVDINSDEADIPDLFGDGKVSVVFEAENQAVVVTMTDATLTSTTSNPVIYFGGGGTYQWLILNVAGHCTLNAVNNAIRLENATMYICSSTPNAKLDINSQAIPVHMQNFADLYIGRIVEHDFSINITTTSSDQPVFYGAGSLSQRLYIYYANLSITTTGNNLITQDIEYLTVLGSISNNVYVYDNKEFYKDGSSYKGSFSITAPYPIRLSYSDHITAENADNVTHAALKKGKISYDKASKTLTLDNVQFEKHITFYTPNVTVYLRGENIISNAANDPDSRLGFIGKDAAINGEKDATLTILCEEKSNGITACGALTIGDFDEMYVKKAKKAFFCEQRHKNSTNLLTVQSTPIQVSGSTENAVIGFDNMAFTNPALHFIGGHKYDAENHLLLTDTDDPAKQMHLGYDTYFFFYGIPVNARNAADISVAGADGKASYDASTKTLTLNNFVKGDYLEPNAISADAEMTIKLNGSNTMHASTTGISTGYNLTIEGPGSLDVEGTDIAGILLDDININLTIRKSASLTVRGTQGIISNTDIMCHPSGGGGQEPGSDEAPVFNIDNASLSITTTGVAAAAIKGFKALNIKDAAMTITNEEHFFFGCTEEPYAFTGVVDKTGQYAKELIITKTGGSAIDQITNDQSPINNKVIRDGRLLIIRGEHVYTITGQEVR